MPTFPSSQVPDSTLVKGDLEVKRLVCVLKATHYTVLGSLGLSPGVFTPKRIVIDTGCGPAVIRSSELPPDWRRFQVPLVEDPGLADANNNPLLITEMVRLKVRLGNKTTKVSFYVAPNLAVPAILGTGYLNRYVRCIFPMDQMIEIKDGSLVAILSSQRSAKQQGESVVDERQQMKEEAPRREIDTTTHVVRLATGVTVPPMTQVGIRVRCKGGGLCYLEPKSSLFERHQLRVANGVCEVTPDQPFTIMMANFSEKKRHIPKGTVVAYAQRNPLALLFPHGKKATNMTTFEKVEDFESHQVLRDVALTMTEDATREEEEDRNGPKASGTSALEEGAPGSDLQISEESEATDWKDTLELGHLSDEMRRRVVETLDKHSRMWDGSLGDIQVTAHRIDTDPEKGPTRQLPYRMGPIRRQAAAKEINSMLEKKVIEPAISEWASPIVLVPKKDGQLRFCVDYRKLNEQTIADAYPLPRMDDCIDSLGDAKIFTTLDCNSGYWQIPVAEEDKDKTTFTSHMGTYRFTRLPFGLKNAPATFQRALDMILSGVRWQSCLIYLDDVIVFSSNEEEHLEQVDQVLNLLRKAGVTLKLSKCKFFQNKVDYLGHVLLPGKLAVARESTEAIRQATFPQNPTQMRSFLGSCNVFRRFVKDYAETSRPLNEMLQKDRMSSFGKEPPTERQMESFEILKAAFLEPPVLALPKLGKPYMLDTDASAYQLGCVLLQEQENGEWKPVGYWSRTLNSAEKAYSPTERECLAVVWSVTKLRPYIEMTKFTVRTDHNALRWLMNIDDPTGRLIRWRLRLSEFDYTIAYRPGRVHQVSDALSRIPTEGVDTQPLDDDIPCLLVGDEDSFDVDEVEEPDFFDPFRARHEADTPLSRGESVVLTAPVRVSHEPIKLGEWLEEQKTDEFCTHVLSRQSLTKDSSFFEDDDGLLLRKSPLDGASQLLVPASLRPRLLSMCNRSVLAGHPGQTRMYDTMRLSYYWPQMAADIAATIRNCNTCAKNRLRLSKRSNKLALFPAMRPLEDVAIDLLGPLPTSNKGNKHLLVISCRFSKLIQLVPLRTITAYNVAVAFTTHWVFKYGPPKTLLSDNGSQFASRLFQAVCLELGTRNMFTSAYHPQTNGQVERFNRTFLDMVRNYVNENQSDWDVYAYALGYAYNTHVHRSTGTTPFELILSRPPPDFSLHHTVKKRPRPEASTKADFLNRLSSSLEGARSRLKKSQARYKRDFDRRVRESQRELRKGDYVYLDVPEKPKSKLAPLAQGPYRVLKAKRHTIRIDRDGVDEKVNVDRVTPAPPPYGVGAQATDTRRTEVPSAQPAREEQEASRFEIDSSLEGTPLVEEVTEVVREADEEEEEYVVDKVLQYHKDDDDEGQEWYLVKWHGYAEPTWALAENIPPELTSRFWKRRKRTRKG